MKNFLKSLKKYLSRFNILILITITPISVIAQDESAFTLPEITRPSPTVAQLMKFEEVSLSHYTGQPGIAIPLFSKSINGLNYNLSLQYQSSGIRVNEQSGWVGKGWALDTGGVISRSVVGLPDEINSSSLGLIGVNHTSFHNLGVYNTLPVHDNAYYFDALWGKDFNQYDYHRDIYQFNFFGQTGRFIFVKENNVLVPKIVGNDSKLKIEVAYENISNSSNHYADVIKSFTITDTNGFVYLFDQVEKTIRNDINVSSYRGDIIPNLNEENIPEFRSAWKLKSVTNASGKNIATLSYKPATETPNSVSLKSTLRYQIDCQTYSDLNEIINNPIPEGNEGRSYEEVLASFLWVSNGLAADFTWQSTNAEMHQLMLNDIHNGVFPALQHNNLSGLGGNLDTTCGWEAGCGPQAYEPAANFFQSYLSIDSKKLTAITFNDGITVSFISTENHPEYFGERLDVISISDNGLLDKTYNFNYDSTMLDIDNNDYDYDSLLFLDHIEVSVPGTTEIQKYTFEYDRLENLKPHGRTNYDDFGYYKSDNPDNYSQEVTSGVLTSISYPTGGKRKFNWQSNTYSYKGDRLLNFFEIFQNPDNYNTVVDGAIHNTQNHQDSNFHQSAYQIIDVTINQVSRIDIDVTSGSEYIEPFHYNVHFEPIIVNGSTTTIDTARDIIKMDIDENYSQINPVLRTGKYRIYVRQDDTAEVEPPYDTSTLDYPITLSINVYLKDLESGPLNWWLYGGGIRVASINDIDENEREQNTAINYALEPITHTLNGITVSKLPTGGDYPGHPGNIGGVDPIHRFSSGSLDSESELTRHYLYSKSIYDFPNDKKAFYLVSEHQNELSAQLTQGSYIGYKNVAEFKQDVNNPQPTSIGQAIINRSVTKYIFDSAIDFPIYPEPYVYPFEPVIEKDYLRGNLREKTTYNDNNQKLTETINSYNYDNNVDIEVPQGQKLQFIINENLLSNIDNLIRTSYNSYADFSTDNRNNMTYNCENTNTAQNYLTIVNTSAYLPNITTSIARFTNESSYKVQLTASDTKEFYYEALPNNNFSVKEVIANQTFTYDPDNHQISEQHAYVERKGISEDYQTKYYYPTPTSTSIFGSAYASQLATENRINTVIGTESFKDGARISTVKNDFYTFPQANSANDVTMLKTVQAVKGEGDPPGGGVPWSIIDDVEDRITYHAYDEYGNPLEISKVDGTHVIYIWGYNHTLPIAKIENYSYQQSPSGTSFPSSLQTLVDAAITASNNDTNATTEDTLRDALNAIRNHSSLSNAYVHTYTYNILEGITSTTDPRGYTMYYEYDPFNRLKYVKDANDNILSENEYNYRPQN
ncbi:hypothetical protein [uncultured Psychroserpens sp.]|uniref:hypothetical protein n=1 Tax=uncultured Psychroserpens sp. TaxID=255436 RepID=UPI00263A022E|nr:hypothetical protein [uncultured Psychroserpens sp.]